MSVFTGVVWHACIAECTNVLSGMLEDDVMPVYTRVHDLAPGGNHLSFTSRECGLAGCPAGAER